MDDQRFDDLTRALGVGLSRRSALRAIGAALGLGVAHGAGQVNAKPAADQEQKKEQKQEEKEGKRAEKLCAGEPDGASCGGDAVCCGGFCRDVASFQIDPNNCGMCGIVCAAGIPCEAGICQYGSAGPGLCSDPTFTCAEPCQIAINSEAGLGCECYSRCSSAACDVCDELTNTCVSSCDLSSQVCDETGTCIDA
jgi:hypothetical protein